MQKSTQAIIAIIVVIILAGGGYAIFHKSSGNNDDTGSAAANNPSSSQSSEQTAPSNKPAAIIQTKNDSKLGAYLADSGGQPLYTYGGDSQGVSNCTGSCLYSWPVYQATATSGLPANVTVITRSDGIKQYAYKGLPLYTFTADSSGQPTGDNVSNFHIAKP